MADPEKGSRAFTVARFSIYQSANNCGTSDKERPFSEIRVYTTIVMKVAFVAPPILGHLNPLKGQRVVIIGGTSGFGMATAKAASVEGASVIVASSKKSNVDRALANIPSGAEGYVLDITQESAV